MFESVCVFVTDRVGQEGRVSQSGHGELCH